MLYNLESCKANSGPNLELRANSTKPSVMAILTNILRYRSPKYWEMDTCSCESNKGPAKLYMSKATSPFGISQSGNYEYSIIYFSDPKVIFPEQNKKYPRTGHVDFVFLSILEDIAVKISQMNYNIGKMFSVAHGPQSTLSVITIL